MTIVRLLVAVLVLALAGVPAAADHGPEIDCGDNDHDPATERCIDEVTLWLHGSETIGELEIELLGRGLPMDRNEPADGDPKSKGVANYAVGPNTNCEGNDLMPTWWGMNQGRVTGQMTVTLHTLAAGTGQIIVAVYPDAGGGCNADARPPAASQAVDVAAGQTETTVTFSSVTFDTFDSLTIMVHGGALAPQNQARLFYDSADTDSRIEFICLAPVGRQDCDF